MSPRNGQHPRRSGDGREGTAIYEITGARHHHFFPDTVVPGPLPG
jgi:hypothetical protein